MNTITILFTCHKCGVTDAPVVMRARDPQSEDILKFTERVMYNVAREHGLRSLFCEAQEVDLKIPLNDGDEYIGQGVSDTTPTNVGMPNVIPTNVGIPNN